MANDFNQTVGSLFQGMDSLLTTKTVVGEPTKVGDTIIFTIGGCEFRCGCRCIWQKRWFQLCRRRNGW